MTFWPLWPRINTDRAVGGWESPKLVLDCHRALVGVCRHWGMLHPVMRRRTWIRGGIALALFATGGGGAASAERLNKESCKSLSVELDSLITAGVKGDMDRGPEWAKANLGPERLGEIKHLMELNEQLEFRCGSGSGTSSRLAKKPEVDDDATGKRPTASTKHGKHESAARSETTPDMKPTRAEGSSDTAVQKASSVPQPAPLALPAPPIAPQSRSALGGAKLEPIAATSKPVVHPQPVNTKWRNPLPHLPQPRRRCPSKRSRQKRRQLNSPRKSTAKPAEAEHSSSPSPAPQAPGKATVVKETSEAPTLGKAQADRPAVPSMQDAATEDLSAPSLGTRCRRKEIRRSKV